MTTLEADPLKDFVHRSREAAAQQQAQQATALQAQSMPMDRGHESYEAWRDRNAGALERELSLIHAVAESARHAIANSSGQTTERSLLADLGSQIVGGFFDAASTGGSALHGAASLVEKGIGENPVTGAIKGYGSALQDVGAISS